MEVSGFGSDTGSYTLSSAAGSNYCPGVETIALGEELSGEMDDEGVAWYGFSGNAGQNLTFWVESTNLDPMLSLYDSQGIMLGNDDNNRDGVDPLLSTTLPEDGNYCLEVNTFGFETGPFTLSMVEGTVFCPGADTLDLDQTVSGSVADGRRTCYTVDLAAGTAYNFAVNSPTSSDTVLELYDSSGSMLVTDDDSGGNLNPLLVFSPDQAGMYYIVIRGYSSGSTGEYELALYEGYGYLRRSPAHPAWGCAHGLSARGRRMCATTFDGSQGQVVPFNVELHRRHHADFI